MRRILVITLFMAFATGASAEERCPNKTCESTWTQWFANTAIFVMAEQYAASKIPALERFNILVAEKAVTAASLASTWVMAKYAAYRGVSESPMTKID